MYVPQFLLLGIHQSLISVVHLKEHLKTFICAEGEMCSGVTPLNCFLKRFI